MDIDELKYFLDECDKSTKVSFGVIDERTGQWYDLEVKFLCGLVDMEDDSIGIQFEENKEYIQAKTQEVVEDLREETISVIDKTLI